jgi:hypothetical protein
MEILRKLVIRMMMLGARERTVKRRRSWREKATSCPLWGFLTERSIKGTTGAGGGVGIFMVPSVERLGKAGGSWFSWAPAGTRIRSINRAIKNHETRRRGSSGNRITAP